MTERLEAAVLCGGLGTRLREAVPGLPKALAPVGGRPFLERLVEQIGGWGVERVVLCSGVGAAAIRERFGGWAGIEFSEEREPLGTAGALALARPRLQTDPVVVLNGDSMVPTLDFAAFWAAHRSAGRAGAMVVVAADERRDAGTLALGPDGRVAAFAEKVAAPGAGYVSAGIYMLSQALLAMIPAGRAVSLEREMMPQWVEHGLHGYVHGGALVDIGTPERWRAAEAAL
jgi:mannose-1-phosphate guanylyltransferase